MTTTNDTERCCSSCGLLEQHVLNDGFALVPIELKIDGRRVATALLGGCCWGPVVRLREAMGDPSWAAHGWATEADAIRDGWDPAHPERDPFGED